MNPKNSVTWDVCRGIFAQPEQHNTKVTPECLGNKTPITSMPGDAGFRLWAKFWQHISSAGLSKHLGT